jgi:hypothetical protein
MKNLVLVLAIFSSLNIFAQSKIAENLNKLLKLTPILEDVWESYSTVSNHPITMMKEAIVQRDHEADSQTNWVELSDNVFVDVNTNGTLSHAGLDLALADAKYYLELGNDEKKQFDAIFNELESEPGIEFGFEGFAQNGCGAPTLLLHIIDTFHQTVYTIDMMPCSES